MLQAKNWPPPGRAPEVCRCGRFATIRTIGIRRHHCGGSGRSLRIDILAAQHTATGASEKILSSGQGAALSSHGISEK
jgi:hypothetical protein